MQGDVASKRRFGVFEFDPMARELTKNGVRLKVQEQPLQILFALLDQPGQIVAREELQQRLWPDGTFVDYEQSLNKAVNKLREALGDSASRPLYIETVPRRGYRFLAPVEGDRAVEPIVKTSASRPQARRWVAVGAVIIASVLATGLWPADVPQVERVVLLTDDSIAKGAVGRLISTGTSVLYGDGKDVWSVPASGGEPRRLSLSFMPPDHFHILVDYSPIRQQILVASVASGNSGLTEVWLAGTEGEAPYKVGEVQLPSRGALAPGADRLALSTPDGIYIQSIESGKRQKVHAMKGMSPALPWWHPLGHSVGFLAPTNDPRKFQAWQVSDDGRDLSRIVPEAENRQGPGAWSLDGKRFFFFLGQEGDVFLRMEAGVVGWLRKPPLVRLTASGQFRTPPSVDPLNPRRLYAVGSVLRGETVRYDRKAKRWVSFLTGFSGEKITRSPDGQWLAYVKFPGSELHKCRIDGSGDVLLASGTEAVNPGWSPDGTRIAFSGRPTGTSVNFKLWLVSAGGGDAKPYQPEIESGYDTIWSGDGKRILLGQGESTRIGVGVLRLETGEVTPVPGSEKLFSPRWSPGEKQILALEIGTFKPRILDTAKGEWRPFSEQPIGYPEWSRDARYIYGQSPEPIRIEVATGRREEIAHIDFKTTGSSGGWVGWTEDWEPLAVRDLSSTQVYRIDLDR
jgi:DNA-binding winged helix-turn-helix (wHTH) protein/Tol biopolymer transport system component